MQETLDAQGTRHFEQGECSLDIRVNHGRGFIDTAVHVRFRSEVYYRIASAHGRLDGGGIADIAPDKCVVRILSNLCQIGQIPCISQLVVINELVILALCQNVADEIGADKSRPARNQNFHRSTRSVASCSSPVRDGLLAPVSATRVLARSRESKVPASVHQPSRTS